MFADAEKTIMNLGRTIAALLVPFLFVGVASQLPACLDDLQVQGGSDAGEDGAGLCTHASAPLPPTNADDPSGDVTFVTAIRSVRFGSGMKDDPLGLDLDRFCSCQGETPSCIAPALQDSELACDALEGRDNGSWAYFRVVALTLLVQDNVELQDLCSEFANLGRWSVLIRVSGYNGLPDDPKVRVDWLPSHGLAPSPPLWNGTDIWPMSAEAIDPEGGPLYYDNDAYVNNGQLVFALTEGSLPITNGLMQLPIYVTSATVMANIAKDVNDRYELQNGVLAGRIPLEEMFEMITDFRDHNGAPFCAGPQNPLYYASRDAFCRGLDIQDGFPQPNKKCDATSLGLGFEAYSIAGIGPVEPPLAGQLNCPPGEDPLTVYLDAGCPP